MTISDCYRRSDHWALRGRHNPTCDQTACAGCEPCHRHCTCRKACPEHINPSNPITAPACIGRTRTAIRAILKLLPDLPDEAVIQGIDSEAAVLAGRALDTPARIEGNANRQLSIAMGRIKGDVEAHSRHPLIVLGWWEFDLRKAYDQELSDHLDDCRHPFCDGCRRITEESSAAYLEEVLDRVAQDPDQDFAKLASEISDCRAHLEVHLHASRRPETGAPCPTCTASLPDGQKAPELRKVYSEHKDQTAKVANRACALGQTVDHGTGRSRCPTCRGDEDTWQCPDVPKHTWTDEDYRRRVDSGYLVNATELTATQMQDVYGIQPATLRTWVARNKVKRRGRNPAGQQLYDVTEAVALRDAKTQKESA